MEDLFVGAARVVDEERIGRVVGLEEAAAVVLQIPRLVVAERAAVNAEEGAAAGGFDVVGERVFAGGAFVGGGVNEVLRGARDHRVHIGEEDGFAGEAVDAVEVGADRFGCAHRLEGKHVDEFGGGLENRVGRAFGQGHEAIAEEEVVGIDGGVVRHSAGAAWQTLFV